MAEQIFLPAEYEKAFSIPVSLLPDWGVSFNASWYAALVNTTTYETVSEDKADWRYVAGEDAGASGLRIADCGLRNKRIGEIARGIREAVEIKI